MNVDTVMTLMLLGVALLAIGLVAAALYLGGVRGVGES